MAEEARGRGRRPVRARLEDDDQVADLGPDTALDAGPEAASDAGGETTAAGGVSITGSAFGRSTAAYRDNSTTDDPGGRIIQMVLRVNF